MKERKESSSLYRRGRKRGIPQTFRLSLSRPVENNILETKDWSWKLDCPSKAPGVSCVETRDDSFNTTSSECFETFYDSV